MKSTSEKISNGRRDKPQEQSEQVPNSILKFAIY
jgi:hypothetical protein